MLVTLALMGAFAGTYALIAALLTGNRFVILAAWHGGGSHQPAPVAASRLFSRA